MKSKIFKDILAKTTPETTDKVKLVTELIMWQSTAKELAEALAEIRSPRLTDEETLDSWLDRVISMRDTALENYKKLSDES